MAGETAQLVVAYLYFGGVAVTAAATVASGLFGWFGGWSDDSWPVFAVAASWFWPLVALIVPFAAWEEYREARRRHSGRSEGGVA